MKWRTDAATDSLVEYGSDPEYLALAAADDLLTTQHEVQLTQLEPAHTYHYAIGSGARRLAGDSTYFFRTSPTPGSTNRFRLWILGDAGTYDDRQYSVRDAFYQQNGSAYTDFWLMLGDNAYWNGEDYEYQAAVFDSYPVTLRQSVLWSTIGNHDTAQFFDPPGSIPYFQIFTLPTRAEAGGVPSGTEKYYSFDYANAHFICLDSMTSDRSTNSPMLNWLRSDLAATDKDWIIAFWHHPPYTHGNHDSDWEFQLVEMRENAVPILEEYGVDLVLSGHSHVYERSVLLNGHYGPSWTLDSSSMVIDGRSGRLDEGSAYRKPAGGLGANRGTIYAVTGSGGQGPGGGSLDHPAMYVSLDVLGSMYLDIEGDRLDAHFIRETGAIDDHFTLLKDAASQNIRPQLAVNSAGDSIGLTWPTSKPAFILEQTTNITSTSAWTTAPVLPSTAGRKKTARVPTAAPSQFFRLQQAP